MVVVTRKALDKFKSISHLVFTIYFTAFHTFHMHNIRGEIKFHYFNIIIPVLKQFFKSQLKHKVKDKVAKYLEKSRSHLKTDGFQLSGVMLMLINMFYTSAIQHINDKMIKMTSFIKITNYSCALVLNKTLSMMKTWDFFGGKYRLTTEKVHFIVNGISLRHSVKENLRWSCSP